MEKRIKMNSASLQERFPEVYREFFSKSSLIASASGSFWFGGEYGILHGGIALLQKLPMKVFVGIQPISKSEIIDGGGWFFVPSKHTFEQFEIGYEAKVRIIDFLQKEMQELYGTDNFPGFKINYLLEVPKECGLNASAAKSAALAVAFLIFVNKITPSDVASWSKKPTAELLKDQRFDQTFRFAWKIESIFHGGSSSGTGLFTSFLKSMYPIVYFCERRMGIEKPENKARFSTRIGEDALGVYDQMKYGGIKIEELEKISGEWPIDFGLIYSGDFIRASMVIKTTINRQEILKNNQEFLIKKMSPILKSVPDNLFDDIFKHSNDLWLTYIKSAIATAAGTIRPLCDMCKKGVDKINLGDLVDAINSNQSALRLLDVSSPKLDMICNIINREAAKLEEDVGCKLTGSGKKGDILFVTSFHGLRDSIWDILAKIKSEVKEDVWLDYASWIDGTGGDGIKIEQDLEKKVYSSFVSSGSVQVKHLTNAGLTHTSLYTYEEFESKLPKASCVLDTIEGDIFVKGKKLGSKDLHTARETVNILKILIDNMGKYVKSSSLPRSSYSTERGEFQSKILTPLTKVMKKYLGKTPDIHLTGGAVDFSIKLGPGFEIYLVEKRF